MTIIKLILKLGLILMFGNDQHGTSQHIEQRRYPSIDQMWEAELKGHSQFSINNPIGSREKWYQLGGQYWDNKSADYDGVMGGFANLSQIDIQFSRTFMASIAKLIPRFNFGTVLDCGAGVGRISKDLLSHLFKTIDVVDQCEKYIRKAKQILKDNNIRHFYCKGLQDFSFQQKYDCIWLQWVLLYLNDEDSVAFLKRAKASLNPGGVIIVKDNSADRGFFLDKMDCSVIRSHLLWRRLFEQAGLEVIKEDIQLDWPKDMYDLRMFALV